jgi:predicted transcriptional regulator
MSDTMATGNVIELTANIVSAYLSNNSVPSSAYLSNNSVPSSDIPVLISQVHSALLRVSAGQTDLPSEPPKPAVAVKRSISPEHLICLEDGKKFKSLKRHLRTQYNMTPEQYREKWSLPPDYPMVAPNYAAARSQLAKQMGLGQQRRRRSR